MGQGKPKEDDIGALWEKSGKGGAYFSGTIKLPDGTKQEIVVFKNRYKAAQSARLAHLQEQQAGERLAAQPERTRAGQRRRSAFLMR